MNLSLSASEASHTGIQDKILSHCITEWIKPQRIHVLRGFQNASVMREDESGFGISGSKRRKLASLIPWILTERFDTVAIIGGSNSNHVVAAAQALLEHGLGVQAFLLKGREGPLTGNAFLIDALIPEEKIIWIDRENWKEVAQTATTWAAQQPQRVFVLPEGGFCEAALPGAATLPLGLDPSQFDHLWMDAGTGLSAIASLLMIGRTSWKLHTHVVLMAGTAEEFVVQLDRASQWWETIFEEAAPLPGAYSLHVPVTARSFGAVNATVWEEVRRLAREEGILADPVYTAKLFLTARELIPHYAGRHLIVHGGGGTGLMGFSG
ncbi:MAG: hypothetical protein NWR72_19905 [Bacteroidia bacterium]|nr:hypothetical protein [Bacteroidia bacterium]